MSNLEIKVDPIAVPDFPYSVEYNTGHLIRFEGGQPIWLWATHLFQAVEEAKAFIDGNRCILYSQRIGQ